MGSQLSKIQKTCNYKIKLKIVGDGVCYKMAANYFSETVNNIDVSFIGTIKHENLAEWLVGNVDILFGVGTSVLEGARQKIPSVCLIMNNQKLKDENNAYWLFNTKDYCLGLLESTKKEIDIKYDSIENILNQVRNSNSKNAIGTQCYNFYLNSFGNFDKNVMNFLNYCNGSTLTIKKLKNIIKVLPYSINNNIFSISILGISIIKRIDRVAKRLFFIFGIRILKIQSFKLMDSNFIDYYLFGIKILTISRSRPFTFINSMRKESK